MNATIHHPKPANLKFSTAAEPAASGNPCCLQGEGDIIDGNKSLGQKLDLHPSAPRSSIAIEVTSFTL